jgi:glycopeptide antibiotics resistance protein
LGLADVHILQKRNIWLGLAWLWVGAVIFLSLTTVTVPVIISWQDKIAHIVLYAIPMWWFMQLYPRQRHWLIALGLFLLGAGLELVQSFHPMRHMDYYDMAANGIGITLGWLSLFTPVSRFLLSVEQKWIMTTS